MKCVDIVYNGKTDFTAMKLYSVVDYNDIMDTDNFTSYGDIELEERMKYWDRFIYKMRIINDVRCIKILFFNEFGYGSSAIGVSEYFIYDMKSGVIVKVVKIKGKLYISEIIRDYELGRGTE